MFNWLRKADSTAKAAPNPEVANIPGEDSIPQLAISESEAFKNQGNAHFGDGNLDEAAACYQHAIACDPRYAEAYNNLGFVYQAQGNLEGAVALYRKAVTFNPDLLTALLNLGFGLMNLGQADAAEESLRRVIALAPEHVAALHSLGVIVAQRGEFLHAETLLRQALELQPGYAQAHFNLGNLFMQAKRLPEAEASYRRALELKPDYADAFNNLGYLLVEVKRLPEAEACYRRALELKPDYAEAHNNLGNLLMEAKRLPEAEASYRRALELKPDYAKAHNNMGTLLLRAKRLPEAEASYRRALELQTDFADTHNNLGYLLAEVRRLPEAEASYRRALELKPDYAEAHNNLGNLLMGAKRLPEAEASYRRALELKPDYAEAHNNLGHLLSETTHLIEAEAAYRRALELNPDYAQAHFNLSLLLLALGRYAEAWPYFEYRYDSNMKKSTSIVPNLPYPQWRGESLAGKSLVIWPEQGFGDYVQFARYTLLLRERGVSRLTLVCHPSLKALLETAGGVDAVITDLALSPSHDYWSFPLSLPLHFGTTVDTIQAAPPYLHALPTRVDRWRDRLPTGKFKVGLVWKGNANHKNDASRSLPGLHTLASLWSVPHVTFISLQKGQGEEEAKEPPADQPILPLGSDINDFADTAAIIDQLDLVICVDTAIAHVAGALGKPCWVLLPAFGTDWRWLRDREDSPWYASMRLFRQKDPADWDRPVEHIRQELFAITHTAS
ncbi:MAG: tetratricopeptide repeat protein [Gallionellaceae bacterium]